MTALRHVSPCVLALCNTCWPPYWTSLAKKNHMCHSVCRNVKIKRIIKLCFRAKESESSATGKCCDDTRRFARSVSVLVKHASEEGGHNAPYPNMYEARKKVLRSCFDILHLVYSSFCVRFSCGFHIFLCVCQTAEYSEL